MFLLDTNVVSETARKKPNPREIEWLERQQAALVSTVSLQLRRLRADGLVERTSDPADRRVSRIGVTAEGRAAVARVRVARRALLDEVLAGTAPVELGRAADVLLRVQEHMAEGARSML